MNGTTLLPKVAAFLDRRQGLRIDGAVHDSGRDLPAFDPSTEQPLAQTPLSALYLGDLALEVGFPVGVLNVIPGYGASAGAALAAHGYVDKIGFTGSTETGRAIVAASTGNLKKVSLELGGKAANIIFGDADFDRALPDALWALFGNNGQSCTAGARLYVQRELHDEVVDGLCGLARRLSVDPGMADPGHDLRAARMSAGLRAGTVWVNCWGDTDLASPFGGMRQSGYGREMGRDAIALYTQTTSVWQAVDMLN